jgi:hypothetical protein
MLLIAAVAPCENEDSCSSNICPIKLQRERETLPIGPLLMTRLGVVEVTTLPRMSRSALHPDLSLVPSSLFH